MKPLFRKFFSSASLILLGAAVAATEAQAYQVRVVVDSIKSYKTTESGIGNTDDEVYFVLAGASQNAPGEQTSRIEVPRISPPPPTDYYPFPANYTEGNILLWQGEIGTGATTDLAIIVADQDNAQLPAIAAGVRSVALIAGGVLVALVGEIDLAGTLTQAGLSSLGSMVEGLINSIDKDDDVIGGIGLVIHNNGSGLTASWKGTTTVSHQFPGETPLSQIFRLNGSDGDYELKIKVEPVQCRFVPAGTWTTSGHNGYGWRVGDLNGDGADDIFRQQNQYGGAEVFLSNKKDQFVYKGAWTGYGYNGQGWYVGDFNGDGADDIFRQQNQYGGAEVILSQRNGFGTVSTWTGYGYNGQGWYIGDFNGDGADDIFRQQNQYGGAEVILSQRNGFGTVSTWTGYGHNGQGWYVGDFNGDGADDILRQQNQYGGAEVILSQRNGFGTVSTWTGYGHNGQGWYVGDFNGDGADDILRQQNQYGGAEVILSQRNGFGTATNWTSAGLGTGTRWHVGDFNGDGADDIFRETGPQGSKVEVFLSKCEAL